MVGRRLAWGFLVIAGLGCLIGFSGCARAPDPWEGLDGGNKKRVVVSFPPLYSFVKAVGGDHVAVICLCITGPHEYEPDVQKSLVLRKADVLFSNGLGLDRFTEKVIDRSDNKNVKHVKLGETLPKEVLLEDEDEDNKDKKVKGHDPHIWLGIDEAVLMVNKIRDELSTLDPAHKDDYTKNAAQYVDKLKALQADGEKRLKNKTNCKIVSSHDALGYFQRTFHLDVTPIVETPEMKPGSAKLAKLVKQMHDEDIRVIAIEPGEDNARKSADVLVEEIKDPAVRGRVKVVEFDPLETATEDDLKAEGGDWYLKRMRHNLDTLIEALP
jgi:zinc transport system substrate-binding protein